MSNLQHDQDASLRFTEAVTDFGSLIIEFGPERVWAALKANFPQQAEQVKQVANTQSVARLLSAPPSM